MSYGFVDKVTISVYAGKGGDGAVTFHREKFVAAGGPDGGDGGRGGDVILVVDDHMSTLMDFRYKRKFVAANGENGLNKRCSGKDGENDTDNVEAILDAAYANPAFTDDKLLGMLLEAD